jgi:hypothetical protein
LEEQKGRANGEREAVACCKDKWIMQKEVVIMLTRNSMRRSMTIMMTDNAKGMERIE